MTSPAEKRERDKARLVEEFIALDVESAKEAIVASWREVAADLEHAAIVASFLEDPEVEELVMTEQLLDWCAQNDVSIAAALEALGHDPAEIAGHPATYGAPGGPASHLRVAAHFQVFGPSQRAQKRNEALTASIARPRVRGAFRTRAQLRADGDL